jgi:hypothetical protein
VSNLESNARQSILNAGLDRRPALDVMRPAAEVITLPEVGSEVVMRTEQRGIAVEGVTLLEVLWCREFSTSLVGKQKS